jgi:catechol-2,3-dioxygenase
MQLSIQAALLNVRNLDKSIEFYQDVLGLRPISREDRVAALMIDERSGRQVLVLRELDGANPVHMGRGTIGPRVIILEAASPDELDAIEQRLTERNAFIGRRRTDTWEAVVGVDPDRIELSISSSLTGAPIDSTHWEHLDQMVYEVGE